MVKEPGKISAIFLFIPLISLLVVSGCRQQAETSTQTTTVRVDSLQKVLTSLNDSVELTWQEMLASDAQKLRHIDTLIQQVGKAGKCDKPLFERVTQLRASLASRQYTRPENLSSRQIDAYDAATDSLITGVVQLYERLPDPDRCENCASLKSRIQETDEAVLPYRLRYDRHAEAYNLFVNQHQSVLRDSGSQPDSLRSKPLFRLAQ